VLVCLPVSVLNLLAVENRSVFLLGLCEFLPLSSKNVVPTVVTPVIHRLGGHHRQATKGPNMQVDDAKRARIIEAYRKGLRILDIEDQFAVSRSTLYSVLDSAGVFQPRANRREEPKDNTAALAALYEIVGMQEKWVTQLETLLSDHGIAIPENLDENRDEGAGSVDEVFKQIVAQLEEDE